MQPAVSLPPRLAHKTGLTTAAGIIDVEDLVVEHLGDLTKRGIFRDTSIREHDIELALLVLDLGDEAIEIAKVRHVPPYSGHICSDPLTAAASSGSRRPVMKTVRSPAAAREPAIITG